MSQRWTARHVPQQWALGTQVVVAHVVYDGNHPLTREQRTQLLVGELPARSAASIVGVTSTTRPG
jgi:hypothetical protein